MAVPNSWAQIMNGWKYYLRDQIVCTRVSSSKITFKVWENAVIGSDGRNVTEVNEW